MTCRKHSPGNPCVCECCGELTTPTEWTDTSECCAQCQRTLTGEWTNVCTDPIRTDTRTATVGVKMYTRVLAVNVGDDPCPESTLCGTTTYTQTSTQELKLVARYKVTKQSDTLTRVQTKCGAEESATCKWLLVSRRCVTIEWGYKWFQDDDQEITNTSECCKATARDVVVAAPSCATAASEMSSQNVTNVCLTRSKYFTSAPSGTITLNPGDNADDDCDFTYDDVCMPVTAPTVSVDTDEITLASAGSSDPIPWTAPYCSTTTSTIGCQYVYKPNAGNCIDAVIIFDDSIFPIGTEEFSTIEVNGSLLGPLWGLFRMTFQAACQGPDLCTDWTIVTKTECVSLSSSQTGSGHTNRSITVALPAWTVDLASCDDA